MISFQVIIWLAVVLVVAIVLAVGTFSASKRRQKARNNEELAALQKDFRRVRALALTLPERYLTDELRSALSVSGVAVLNRMISISRGRPRYMTEDLVEIEALAEQSSVSSGHRSCPVIRSMPCAAHCNRFTCCSRTCTTVN